MSQQYARAPLTEAVIEFRLASPLSDADLEKVRARFAKLKWKAEQAVEIELLVSSTGTPNAPRQSISAYKFTSPAADVVVQTRRQGLAVSRHAPYPGWEAFLEDVHTHWDAWRKVIGKRTLGRIGVRYVNRIDIPFETPNAFLNLSDYFNFTINKPSILDAPVKSYVMHYAGGMASEGLGVILNGALVPPVLINHFSFSLDIDFYRDVDVPQVDSDIWVLIDAIRDHRTAVFQECITDATRALIQ